jgi:hypothetical protein
VSTPTLQPESAELRCARHPGTETVLRCGRCETPICPRCAIPTPVGARCPTCAQVKRFALLLKPAEMARAVGFGVAVGAVGSILATLVPLIGPLFGYAIVGFAVGEATSRGANRKRARELAPIAVANLFVGYWLGLCVFLLARSFIAGLEPDPTLLLLPILLLRSSGQIVLGLLLGALLAWMRVR